MKAKPRFAQPNILEREDSTLEKYLFNRKKLYVQVQEDGLSKLTEMIKNPNAHDSEKAKVVISAVKARSDIASSLLDRVMPKQTIIMGDETKPVKVKVENDANRIREILAVLASCGVVPAIPAGSPQVEQAGNA